jgi:hypothetical protein
MRRSRKWNATLGTAHRGRAAQARQRAASREVKQLLNRYKCLTSPVAPKSKVALHNLVRRDNPSSKEGIRIHDYSGSSLTMKLLGRFAAPFQRTG